MPYLKIIRPVNIIFVMLTTFYGALYPHFHNPNKYVWFAAFSAALISAAGYVVNDYFDRNIDKINRPDRMIPSGKISPYRAYMFAMFLFITGLSLAFFTGKFACIIMAFVNTFFMFFYAKKWKNTFLFGNFIVAYAAASTFVYGAFTVNNLNNIFPVAIVAFLFTLIREFVKDAQDYKGDKQFGAKTVAVVLGKEKAVLFAFIVSLILLGTAIAFYFFGIISLKLTLLFSIINIVPVILVLNDLRKKTTDKNFIVSSHFLKFEMLLVLIIFYFGR